MEIKKAEIQDLDIVVKLKIEMFTEVGSIALLQENVEEQIYETYKKLYEEDRGCHYLAYENDSVIACGGAVIKSDVPFCFFKPQCMDTLLTFIVFPKREEMDMLQK